MIDNFSKYGWSIPLRIKHSQKRADIFENTFISSKRKPKLIETDRRKEFYNVNFQNFSFNNDIELCSRKGSIVLFLRKKFIVLSEIVLKDQFWKRVIGLMYWP